MFSSPLLGRPRSWAVPAPGPSPLLGRPRSWAASGLLLLCLLLVPSVSRAGSYSLTSQTGGISLAHTDGQTYSSSYYSSTSADYGAGAGTGWHPGGKANDASCTGLITTVFTWMPGYPSEPPPSCVIEIQTCTARYDDVTGENCWDGLGSDPGDSGSGTGGGHVCSKTLYTVQSSPGANFTETCSPSASISGPANYSGGTNGTVSVYYSDSLIVPPQLQAHSTVDSANWDAKHPRFFSGTNCSVSGTALAYTAPPGNSSYPAGGSYVKQATLTIGGMAVKSYYDTSVPGPYPLGAVTGANQSSASLSVFFDSTHFSDNTSISIQMTVTDSGGLTYTVPLQANAYNKGYDGGGSGNGNNNQTLDGAKAASFVQGQYLSANITPTLGPSDSRSATLSSIPKFCDFFTYAHGIDNTSGSGRVWFGATDNIVDNFGNDYTIYGAQQTDPNTRTGVKEAVANKTVYQPPYNFVFLDTCNSAFESDLANGFGISTLTASDNDCAFLGWQTLVEDSLQNANWANYVFQDLQNGQTISQAVHDADQYYQSTPLRQSSNPLSGPAQHSVLGDGAMTLHGTVYNGPLHQWYR